RKPRVLPECNELERGAGDLLGEPGDPPDRHGHQVAAEDTQRADRASATSFAHPCDEATVRLAHPPSGIAEATARLRGSVRRTREAPRRITNAAERFLDILCALRVAEDTDGEVSTSTHRSPPSTPAAATALERFGVGLGEVRQGMDIIEQLRSDQRACPVPVGAVVRDEGAQRARCRVVAPTRTLPEAQPFFTVTSMSAPARSPTASPIRAVIPGWA